MQPPGDTGENRTPFRAGAIADGDDVGEHRAGLGIIEHALGLAARNINAHFTHCFDDDRVQPARFEARALCASNRSPPV